MNSHHFIFCMRCFVLRTHANVKQRRELNSVCALEVDVDWMTWVRVRMRIIRIVHASSSMQIKALRADNNEGYTVRHPFFFYIFIYVCTYVFHFYFSIQKHPLWVPVTLYGRCYKNRLGPFLDSQQIACSVADHKNATHETFFLFFLLLNETMCSVHKIKLRFFVCLWIHWFALKCQ